MVVKLLRIYFITTIAVERRCKMSVQGAIKKFGFLLNKRDSDSSFVRFYELREILVELLKGEENIEHRIAELEKAHNGLCHTADSVEHCVGEIKVDEVCPESEYKEHRNGDCPKCGYTFAIHKDGTWTCGCSQEKKAEPCNTCGAYIDKEGWCFCPENNNRKPSAKVEPPKGFMKYRFTGKPPQQDRVIISRSVAESMRNNIANYLIDHSGEVRVVEYYNELNKALGQ